MSVYPALLWASNDCCTARICRLRAKAQLSLEVLYFPRYKKKEDMLCSSSAVLLLWSKDHAAVVSTELPPLWESKSLWGSCKNRISTAAADTQHKARAVAADHPLLPTAEDSCLAVPSTAGLQGAVPVPGLQFRDHSQSLAGTGTSGLLSCEVLGVEVW